jgi:hypothetical protein
MCSILQRNRGGIKSEFKSGSDVLKVVNQTLPFNCSSLFCQNHWRPLFGTGKLA